VSTLRVLVSVDEANDADAVGHRFLVGSRGVGTNDLAGTARRPERKVVEHENITGITCR